MKSTKNLGLLFLIGALVAIILLATSLSNLQLETGDPSPGIDTSEKVIQPIPSLPPVKSYAFPILQGIFALIFLILVIYLTGRIIFLANIKTILQLIPPLGILLIILYFMPSITLGQPDSVTKITSEVISPSSFKSPITPLGQPPQTLIWVVIIGFILGISIPVFKMVKGWLVPTEIETGLLREAESAVNALNQGANLRNVIVRCYMQMMRSLKEEQGIERNRTMTVRELEELLQNQGFPMVPVHQLTYLFEKVRYGKQQTTDEDKEIALESLNEIIQFCRMGSV